MHIRGVVVVIVTMLVAIAILIGGELLDSGHAPTPVCASMRCRDMNPDN